MNLLQLASERTGLTVDQILGSSRRHDIVMVRHCLIWAMRNRFNMTLTEIGRQLDRDHTSIIYALKSVQNYMSTNYDKYLTLQNRIFHSTEREGESCYYCYGITINNFYTANLTKRD